MKKRAGYLLPTADRCKRCGAWTSLACDGCGLTICTLHSRITGAMRRLCLSCLAQNTRGKESGCDDNGR